MNFLLSGLVNRAMAIVYIPSPTIVPPSPPFTGVDDITIVAHEIVNWLFWGLIVLSIVMFLVGGYRYVTSGGEPEKISGANKTLRYAAIAVVIAIVAAGVPTIIGSFFGVYLAPFLFF